MKNMNTQDTSILSKLSIRTRNTLDALMRSPVAVQAIEQVEAEQLNQRRALVAELAEVEAANPAVKTACIVECERAAQAFEKAEQAFTKAKAALEAARMTDHGTEVAYLLKRRSIADQLTDSADPRLAEFAFICDNLLTVDLVVAPSFWIETKKGILVGKSTVQCSNMDLVEAAKTAVKGAIAQAMAMQFEAATYAQVSQALSNWCADLAKPLATLELNPPSLTAEHTEVGRPLKWQGRSTWVLDQLPVVTVDDLRAKADADKAKADQGA